MCNPGRAEGVRYQDRKKLGTTKEKLGQAGVRDPHARRPTPRAPHLSRNRPAAPECGKRGSLRRYKGRAARMSTVRGAREEGAGSLSRGAGRWPSSSALARLRSRVESRAKAPPPRSADLCHLDAASVPGGGAKAGVRVSRPPGVPASGVSERL